MPEAFEAHISSSLATSPPAVAANPAFSDIIRTPIHQLLGAMLALYIAVALVMFHLKDITLTATTYCGILIPPLGLPLFAKIYLRWPEELRLWLSSRYNLKLVASGCLLIILTFCFHSVFQPLKASFASFVPFYLDDWLSDMDRRVLFGHVPWYWLQGLYSNYAVVHVTDFCYSLWLLLDVVVLVWQAFAPKNAELRATYFLAYFLVWIVLGTVIALAGSSAGPCYFHYVSTSPDPYAEQMQYLANVDTLGAVAFQKVLWQNHIDGTDSIVNGVSAFPSIHVAMACVFFLLSLHYGRILRILAGFFFAVILVGSVALGWHYAVGDVFSVTATVTLWYFSKMVVRKYKLADPRPGAPSPALRY